MPQPNNPSLYEMLTQHFSGGLELHHVNEGEQRVMSVLDNLQRILNSRAGQLAHLPDYGLPDMSEILQGMPGSAHRLMTTMSQALLKYEPRLAGVAISLLPQTTPGRLEYTLDAELKGMEPVRFSTTFTAHGKVLVRHLKQQQWLER